MRQSLNRLLFPNQTVNILTKCLLLDRCFLVMQNLHLLSYLNEQGLFVD